MTQAFGTKNKYNFITLNEVFLRLSFIAEVFTDFSELSYSEISEVILNFSPKIIAQLVKKTTVLQPFNSENFSFKTSILKLQMTLNNT